MDGGGEVEEEESRDAVRDDKGLSYGRVTSDEGECEEERRDSVEEQKKQESQKCKEKKRYGNTRPLV